MVGALTDQARVCLAVPPIGLSRAIAVDRRRGLPCDGGPETQGLCKFLGSPNWRQDGGLGHDRADTGSVIIQVSKLNEPSPSWASPTSPTSTELDQALCGTASNTTKGQPGRKPS